MRKTRGRLVSVLLLISMLLTLCASPAAATDLSYGQIQMSAEIMHDLGLLNGVGTLPDGKPDFNLDAPVTRGEAVTMIVRLMGGEQEALAMHYPHPYQDAGWASDYIGYAYQNGITYGVTQTQFGTAQPVTCAQYLTLALRALGKGADVDWRNPYPVAQAAGLVYPLNTEYLIRADMVVISYSALDCEFASTGLTLYQILMVLGVLDNVTSPTVPVIPPDPAPSVTPPPTPSVTPAPTPAVTPSPVPESSLDGKITVNSPEEMFTIILAAMQSKRGTVEFEVPRGQEEAYCQAMFDEINRFQDVTKLGATMIRGTGYLEAELTFADYAQIEAYLEGKTAELSLENQQVLQAAQTASASIINSSMGEYEKVKAIHDYLVNFNTYQETGDRSHNAVGALVDGKSVCDGYTKAFMLMCYLNGIDCVRVCGTAGGNHAWNKVKVGGVWYNIDVTWDDPVSSRPVLRYDYFLVSDATLAEDHWWTPYAHIPASPADYS